MVQMDRTPRLFEQPRDELWGHRAHYHGPMPTPYFLEYSPKSARGGQMCLLRLVRAKFFYKPIQRLKLFNEKSKPEDKPFENSPHVYANDTNMEELLLKKGLIDKISPPINPNNFYHDFFLACTSASIELGIFAAGGEYLFEHQFHTGSNDIPCELEYVEQRRGKHGWDNVPLHITRPLIPDRVFMIRKAVDRIMFLEVDRGFESTWSTDPNKKTWRVNFKQYIQLIESGYYKQHYGVTCGAAVLFVFNERVQMVRAMEELLHQTDGKGKSYMFFKLWTDFYDRTFIPRVVNYDLINTPWERVGHDKDNNPYSPVDLVL